jgi:glycosyltransferase involved in cell wall biosynthesis
MKTAIIIPAYNEEQRIGKTLEAYSSYFKKKKSNSFNYEIIVVINNTSDNTEAVVKKYQKKDNHISYLNLKRGGKGYAVQEGFKYALKTKINFLGFVDADLATPPEAFYDLITKINGYDGVLASRYLPESINMPAMTFKRRFISRVFNFLVRSILLLPYKDTQCGAKLFTSDSIRRVLPKLGMTQWAFDIELLYEMKKQGFVVKDIPTIWRDVKGSKIKVFKSSLQMLLSLFQLRIYRSPFKRLLNPLRPLVITLWRKVQ